MMCEATLVAVLAYPSAAARLPEVYPTLCPRPTGDMSSVARKLHNISSLFTAGVLLCILGGALRLWTYRVLGRLFTYEITVRSNHTLVTTGPYALVRHPSYAALAVNVIGSLCVLCAQREWEGACGLFEGVLGRGVWVWPVFWVGLIVFTARSVWRRGEVEDELMRREFGVVWEKYREEVTYKFFPGLI